MFDRTIQDFGGPYVDQKVVKNPESQMAAAKGNRLFEDSAQMTRTALRAEVHFPTVGAGNPTVSFHRSVWGSSDSQKPAVTRTGAGLYTITYGTSFTDALGVLETVSFLSGMADLVTANDDRVKISSIVANVITLKVRNSTGTPSDLTPGELVVVWLR